MLPSTEDAGRRPRIPWRNWQYLKDRHAVAGVEGAQQLFAKKRHQGGERLLLMNHLMRIDKGNRTWRAIEGMGERGIGARRAVVLAPVQGEKKETAIGLGVERSHRGMGGATLSRLSPYNLLRTGVLLQLKTTELRQGKKGLRKMILICSRL